jgi:hypothetical protein
MTWVIAAQRFTLYLLIGGEPWVFYDLFFFSSNSLLNSGNPRAPASLHLDKIADVSLLRWLSHTTLDLRTTEASAD